MSSIQEITRSVSIGSCFTRGWEVYKANVVTLVVALLLVGLISCVSLGICTAPMLCGLSAMVLAMLRTGAKPEVGDVFRKFDKFGTAFVTSLALGAISFIGGFVLSLVPVLGWIANVVWSVALGVISAWALLLIVDQDASIGEAITVPLKQIGNDKFWSVILTAFVANLIAMAGVLACGIGVLFTAPLATCIVVAAYEEAHGRSPQASATPPLPPSSPTPDASFGA